MNNQLKKITLILLIFIVLIFINSVYCVKNLSICFFGELEHIENINDCPYTDFDGIIYTIPISIKNNTNYDINVELEQYDFDEFHVLYAPSINDNELQPKKTTWKNTMYFLFDKEISDKQATDLIKSHNYKYSFKIKYGLMTHHNYILKSTS